MVATDRPREKSDVPHLSLYIGVLQTWRTRSCRHSLPRYFPFGFTKEVQAVVLGPKTSKTENEEASEGKYNLVFTSEEALFDSHRSSILAPKNKIQAVFIDEVHCVAEWLVFFLCNF